MGKFQSGPLNPMYWKHPNLGPKNGQWKGNAVGYKSLHEWIAIHLPKPELCPNCKQTKPYDVANISGKYLRDLTDWQWLCRRCHMLIDGRLTKIRAYALNRKKCFSHG